MDGVLAARPELFPKLQTYLDQKAITNTQLSSNKRKTVEPDASAALNKLFDTLAPPASSLTEIRPSKLRKITDHRAFQRHNNALDGLETSLVPSTPTTAFQPSSATESLQKRFEHCFGVVPNTSTFPFAHPQKRKRSFEHDVSRPASLNSAQQIDEARLAPVTESRVEGESPTKRVQTTFNSSNAESNQALVVFTPSTPAAYVHHNVPGIAGHSGVPPNPVQAPSTWLEILELSQVDLAQICPFSLYPNSRCVWGSECRMKRVCTVRM